MFRRAAGPAFVLAGVLLGCFPPGGPDGADSTPTPRPTGDGRVLFPSPATGQVPVPAASSITADDPVTFSGAGDIAEAGGGQEETAKVLDGLPGYVFALGDLAYPVGSNENFRDYYAPTWGRHKHRTFPVIGNHEYVTPGAAGYFAYWGFKGGSPEEYYYSFNLNPYWHVVVINTECNQPGFQSCVEGRKQYEWVKADLIAHAGMNTIVLGHVPNFSSGFTNTVGVFPDLWKLFYRHGVEMYLAGHDHSYERMKPVNERVQVDEAHGVRQFIVGTAGAWNTSFSSPPLSFTEVRNDKTLGVLKLTLRKDAYDWEFIPAGPGASFTDRGTSPVHGAP